MPRPASKQPILRRSVALPQGLVKLAQSYLPPEQRGNLNGLVKQALEDFVRQHRRDEFWRSVELMAKDPMVIAENKRFLEETAYLDEDGLK
jgi:hypothetical protein